MTAGGTGFLVAGLVAIAVTALLGAAVLAPRGVAVRACAWWVLAATAVVVPLEALSFAHSLTRGRVLLAQLALAAVSVGAWTAAGRPPVLSEPPRQPLRRLLDGAAGRALLVLAVVVAAAVGTEAGLAVAVAPNESDTLGYHLVRAMYWLQDASALQYQPNLDDPAQVQPAVAELLVTWVMGLSRSDRLAQLVQWVSLLASGAGVAALAGRLGAGRRGATWCAGLAVLAPVALLESSTCQNDLVLTAALLATTVLLLDGLRARSRRVLLLAGLAAGLALGTKLTAVIALPLLLGVAVALVRRHRPGLRFLAGATALAAAAAVPAGAFVYAQNEVNLGRVTGFSGTPVGDFVQADPLRDVARAGATLVDASGLAVPEPVQRATRAVERPLFRGVHGSRFAAPSPPVRTEPNDDESAYGLAGLLVGVPVLLLSAVGRRQRLARRAAALGALGYGSAVACLIGYSPEDARYLMPAAAVGAALLAPTLDGPRRRWVVLALAVATVPGTLLLASGKPVLPVHGDASVLALGRIEQQTQDPDQRALLHRLDALAGPHGAVGLVQQDAVSDYLVGGGPLRRRVVTFDPSSLMSPEIRRTHVRGVLIAAPDQDPCTGDACRPGPGVVVTELPGGAVWLTVAP